MAEERVYGLVEEDHDEDSDQVRLLRLRVIGGHDLAKKDIFGACDPLVKIDLVPNDGDIAIDTVYTQTKKKTLNPKWDEEFIFRVKPNKQHLLLEVYDDNQRGRDDFLGLVELSLKSIPGEKASKNILQKFYFLRPRSFGISQSKVKGHLQLYHAYIDLEKKEKEETQSVAEFESGWKVVDVESEPVEEPAMTVMVCVSAPSSRNYRLSKEWEERQDANGKTYYVNHVARTTQWDFPTELLTTENSSLPLLRRHVLNSTIHSLLNDANESNSTRILNQMGFVEEELFRNIFFWTTNSDLRSKLVQKYQLLRQLADSEKQNFEFLELINEISENLCLSFQWVIRIPESAKQQVFIASSFDKEKICKKLFSLVNKENTWYFYVNNNTTDKITKWVQSCYFESSLNMPIVSSKMLDYLEKNGLLIIRECLTNELAKRGILIKTEETKDFNKTIYRLGRANDSSRSLVYHDNCPFKSSLATISQELFFKKFLSFCLENHLYELLYFYVDDYRELCKNGNISNFLVQMALYFVDCANITTNSKILTAILGCAQVVFRMDELPTVKVLFEKDFVDLALLALFYSQTDIGSFFWETCDQVSYCNDNVFLSSLQLLYPIIHATLAEIKNTSLIEPPSVYTLLNKSMPFDISRLFSWQLTNSFRCADDDVESFNELPHFAQGKLVDDYGLKATLTFTYYLSQGRPLEAFEMFIKSKAKNMDSISRKISVIAYNDNANIQVSTACVIFQQLLNLSSSALCLHLAMSNLILQYAGEFLSLNPKTQQIELSRLLKKVDHYKNNRAAGKLLQLAVTAFGRKYSKHSEIQIEECFDWQLIVQFCFHYNLDLPTDFLQKCAQEDNWLVFILFAQLYEYPPEALNVVLRSCAFNNECIADHLMKAFQNSRLLRQEKEQENKILKHKYKDNLRKNLYEKIGVSQAFDNFQRSNRTPPRTDSQRGEEDEQSIFSENDFNNLETISVVSSTNFNDSFEFPSLLNSPKDLLWLTLLCERSCPAEPWKALLHSCISNSNPILPLIAFSFWGNEEQIAFESFCCWLISSMSSDVRKLYYDKKSDFLRWSVEDSYVLIKHLLLDVDNFKVLYNGIEIFLEADTPLKHLTEFFVEFLIEKNYHDSKKLKDFQDHIWKKQKNIGLLSDENEWNTWVQNVSVIIICSAFKTILNSYEVLILLRHLEFARIQSTFTKEVDVPDFRRLYRLCQCVSETGVSVDVKKFLETDVIFKNAPLSAQYKDLVLLTVQKLQELHYFNEAKQFAVIGSVDSQEIVVNEWTIRAENNRESYGFWVECWSNLVTTDSSLSTVLDLFRVYCLEVLNPLAKAFLLFKCLTASDLNDINCENMETQLWLAIVDIELQIEEVDGETWNKLSDEIFYYLKFRKINSSFSKKTIKLSDNKAQILFKIILKKLANFGCIEEAQKVAAIFGVTNSDLEIIETCHKIAKGLIKNSTDVPTFVQWKVEGAIDNKKFCNSEMTTEQKESFELIETLTSLTTVGRFACRRISLYFKISCIFNQSYIDLINGDLNDLEIVKMLISASLCNQDALFLAKELINLNNIGDEEVAIVVCQEVFQTIKTFCSDSASSNSSSTPENVGFLSMVRLINDPAVLGRKLLHYSTLEEVATDLSVTATIEVYIKSHDCFTMVCDMEGIALVLRKSRHLIMQKLVIIEDYHSIMRLLTGIGRYSEMSYCFDILKEKHQFEILLGKRVEKVPQLRIALMNYLKGDKDMYPLVALSFCMYREIAESHEISAIRTLQEIDLRHSVNKISYLTSLESVMVSLIDAQESYSKAGCHNHADSCAKLAQLIALQIYYLFSNVTLINLTEAEITEFVTNHENFFEASIAAEAYQNTRCWSFAIFNNVVLKANWNYLRDFTSLLELTPQIVEDISQKYLQYLTKVTEIKGERLSIVKASMQRLLGHIEEIELRFKISWQLGFVELANSLLQQDKGSYLRDLHRSIRI